ASFGADHPDVARDLNNLAGLLLATNRLKEAEPLMERVVTIFEKAYGEKHPNIATSLNNLAQLLKATNQLEEAEPLMRRALAIDEASFGADHPKVATALSNLAGLLADTNRLKEAEPLMERVVVILLQFTRQTGHPHPHLKTTINNYGSLLMQMGYSEEQIAARLKGLDPEMF
ncbi:MAG: tetratricopeptide repeat protein, partial [Sedimentisphaerales bacterium]|nr:tetratricopeptide repeat protein [Sedimentisphaerales bacterium]